MVQPRAMADGLGSPSDVVDAAVVHRWAVTALASLTGAEAELNRLNVFPVRDSDTGTNLVRTVTGALRGLEESTESAPTVLTAPAALAALADGAIGSARGNSGAILAQFLAGVAHAVNVGAPADPLDGAALAAGLAGGSAAARRAVAVPVEGTALTVLQSAATAARAAGPDHPSAAVLVCRVGIAAREAVNRTPEQLPELAAAGVVDAGGLGVVLVLEALAVVLSAPDGASRAAELDTPSAVTPPGTAWFEVQYLLEPAVSDAGADVAGRLRASLARLGESVVVGDTARTWSVHVHLPASGIGAAIEAGISVGVPRSISVEPLPAATDEPAGTRPARLTVPGPALPAESEPSGPAQPVTGHAILALATSDGVASLVRDEGAETFVWQPATEDSGPVAAELLAAVLATGAPRIALLANDRRARSVAEAVAASARAQGVEVAVVPSRSAVQGLAALAVHTGSRPLSEDVIAMTDAAAATRTARISVAQSDAITYAGRCSAGDLLGLIDGEVVALGTDVASVAVDLVGRLIAAGGELVTVLVGATGAEAGRALDRFVRRHHPLVEITLLPVGELDSPLLIGVE